MYVAVVPNRGSPPAILLRESYREAGKTKNRTLANLSRWPAERIEQLRAVLRGDKLLPAAEAVEIVRALPPGHRPASGPERHPRGRGPQFFMGLVCAADGSPVAVGVCGGNTADPLTLSSQIEKLKQRFRLQRVVMVGDRGVLTSARLEQTLRPAGLDWITALRAPAIKQLAAEGGPLQPSLFDDRDMAEIPSPDHPGERLVVCQNPLLAAQRARKRAELLAVTENDLARIAARVQRARKPLRGAPS